MMLRPYTSFVLATLSLLAQAQDSTPKFSFKDYLSGEWNVERFAVTMATSEMTPVSSGTYQFEPEKESDNLVGFWTPGEAGEDGEVVKDPVSVEFDALNTGSFKIGEDNDLLFSFYFQHFNGPWISHGEWNGVSDGFYQFNVVASDKFTITVFTHPMKEDGEVILFSASRVKSAREKSFFEKYGSTMMMVVLFLLFQRMKGDPRGQGGGGAGEPTVEEKKNQ